MVAAGGGLEQLGADEEGGAAGGAVEELGEFAADAGGGVGGELGVGVRAGLCRTQSAQPCDKVPARQGVAGCRRKVAGRSPCRRRSGMRLGQTEVTALLAKVSKPLPGRRYT